MSPQMAHVALLVDLNVNADEFEELIRLIRELFTRLDEWDLRINGAKTVINVPSCTYLGHEVDGEGKRHTKKRMSGIQNMQRPHDRQQIKAFMGGPRDIHQSHSTRKPTGLWKGTSPKLRGT